MRERVSERARESEREREGEEGKRIVRTDVPSELSFSTNLCPVIVRSNLPS